MPGAETKEMLTPEGIRQTFRVWSCDERLMELLSQRWDVEFPKENLAAALFHLKDVFIEPVGNSFQITIGHPQKPLELLVPMGALLSVLGFQDWMIRLDPHAFQDAALSRERVPEIAWLEYS